MEVTQFIANKEDKNFFDTLFENLKNCSEFKMSVAFISWGGIQNFFTLFEELQKRNVKGQILRQLEKEKFMTIVNMSEEYFTFKRINCDNKVPFLTDFLKPGLNIDPLNFCRIHSRKTNNLIPSYIHFITEIDAENTQELAQVLQIEAFNQFIMLISSLLPAVRIDEWCILNKLLNSKDYAASTLELFEEIHKYVDIEHSNNLLHACEILSGNHYNPNDTKKYQKGLCIFNNDTISFNKGFISELESNPNSSIFKLWINDIIHYALVRYTEEFGRNDYGYPFLKLYHGYSMKQQAFTTNYQNSISAFRGNGLISNCKPDYFIFVDLYKDENIREEINYKDKFLTRNRLHLFVRKYKEIEKVTQPYIYFGKIDTHPDSAEGEKPITMIFALENELPQDLFEDFMTNEKFIEIEDNK